MSLTIGSIQNEARTIADAPSASAIQLRLLASLESRTVIKKRVVDMQNRESLLRIALAACGAGFLLVYPMAIIWPSGWVWHHGSPYESQYFVMIVGVYATLGVFLLLASRDPQSNLSLIWFTIWSSLVHAGIMGVQSLNGTGHMGHLMGDVPALVLVAAILTVLVLPLRKV